MTPAGSTPRVINVASVPHRSPFRYPGGKTWLVPYVRQWVKSLPYLPHEFAEPFAGGAIVGLSVLFEDLAHKLTIVEIDPDVASVWKTILSMQGERLAAKIASYDLTSESVRWWLRQQAKTLFDRAFQTILKNRVQRGGIMAPGAGLVKKGENGRGLASRWYPETLQRRILAIVEQRHRIRFVEGDGIEFIKENLRRNEMAFFLDPPYTIAGRRLYAHSVVDHEALFRTASRLHGDFLMSYDNVQPIRDLARKHGFQTEAVTMKNTHHSIMRELLVGRDLSWLSRPLEFRDNPLLENLQSNRNPSRQPLHGTLQCR